MLFRSASVTTGAFYGYFKSKEALFEALAGEAADYFMSEYKSVQESFRHLSPQEQEDSLGKVSGDWMMHMIDYIYEHFDAFKLILCCAEGTKYENFIHELVEIEVKATHDFLDVLEGSGKPVKRMDPNLEHILISGMFSGFFEIVIHNMPKNQAPTYIREMIEFQTAGWKKVMGL